MQVLVCQLILSLCLQSAFASHSHSQTITAVHLTGSQNLTEYLTAIADRYEKIRIVNGVRGFGDYSVTRATPQ